MAQPIELLPSPEIDEFLLASERLENLRGTMLVDGLDVLVLTNPVSIRYATGYRAYTAFQSRIPSAYAIVPIVGPIIMHGAYVDDVPLVEVSRRSHAITSTRSSGPFGRTTCRPRSRPPRTRAGSGRSSTTMR